MYYIVTRHHEGSCYLLPVVKVTVCATRQAWEAQIHTGLLPRFQWECIAFPTARGAANAALAIQQQWARWRKVEGLSGNIILQADAGGQDDSILSPMALVKWAQREDDKHRLPARGN